MAGYIIPVERLSPEALAGVIDAFVAREGTDYGVHEASRETKFRQVKEQLLRGTAVLVFDEEAESVNILPADDPVLKKLDGTEAE
jgi:uncharacterized protein